MAKAALIIELKNSSWVPKLTKLCKTVKITVNQCERAQIYFS